VEAGARIELGPDQSEKFLPKTSHELAVPVTHNVLGELVQLEDIPKEQFCNLCSHVFGGDGEKLGVLGQPVEHYINAILPLHCGEPCDEIHRYTFPFALGDGKRL